MNQKSSNSFRIYIQARKAYQKHNFSLAIKKLIRIPVRLQNRDVNHLLVKSLYNRHRYHSAEAFMMVAINTYTENWALARLMLQIFVKNRDFIRGREVVAVFNSDQIKQKAYLMIGRAEALDQRTNLKGIRHLVSRFYHLADQSFIKQRRIRSRALKLPLSDFLKVAKPLLMDPFLHPLMRLSILEVLCKVGIKGVINYRWLNGRVYPIRVDQLDDLTRMNSYRQIVRIVDQDYSANPVNALILKQNLRLELSYLYPFTDREVKLPRLWVRIAYLMLRGESPLPANKRGKRIYRLQRKLNRMTSRLKK